MLNDHKKGVRDMEVLKTNLAQAQGQIESQGQFITALQERLSVPVEIGMVRQQPQPAGGFDAMTSSAPTVSHPKCFRRRLYLLVIIHLRSHDKCAAAHCATVLCPFAKRDLQLVWQCCNEILARNWASGCKVGC